MCFYNIHITNIVRGRSIFPYKKQGVVTISSRQPTQYEVELHEHINKVRDNISRVNNIMSERAEVHDSSKFSDVEFDTFERVSPQLRETTYMSPEYKSRLKELGSALTNHYAVNDHHPEHFPNGINDMNLFQLTEMLCDWIAGCEKHDDGNKMDSLEINRGRFGIDDQLYNILKNTLIEWDKK